MVCWNRSTEIFYDFMILAVTVFLFILALVDGQNTDMEPIELQIWPQPGSDNTIRVPVGQKKLISCTGNVPFPDLLENIKWYWPDGREILKENTDPARLSLASEQDPPLLSLDFLSVSETDVGTYRCEATYAKTTPLKISFILNTYVPITFEDAKEDQYATKGENYKIVCRVKSNPSPRITWSKDHVRVTNSDHYAIEPDGLVVKNVKEADEGVYKCRAVVRTLGDTQERFIKLQVQEKPRIVNLVKEVEGVEGETVRMKCTGEGKPKPEVQWQHRGQPLYGIPRHTVDKYEGTLIIDDVRVEDAGAYTCIVENNAGFAEGTTNLVVITKPVIEQFLNVTTQVNSLEAVLTCRATGSPPPEITFQKESSTIPYVTGVQSDIRIFTANERGSNGMTIGTLKIKDILRTDDGLYKCIASNGRTRTELMGHLTVEFPPTFDRTPATEAWAWGGRPANLTCFAEAIPNATISWFDADKRPVIEDINHIIFGRESESTLQVRNVGPSSRFFQCEAINKLGKATHGILLREAQVPGPIQQVITAGVTATSVSFKIAGPVSDGGLPVEYFVVHFKPERESWDVGNFVEKFWPIAEEVLTIENLEPLRSYSFRFAAKNEVGNGVFVERVVATTKIAPPGKPLIFTENSSGYAYSPYPNSAEVKWSSPPDNGEIIDKFEVSYIPVRNISGRWESEENEIDLTVPSPRLSVLLDNLKDDTFYRVEVKAHNNKGWGKAGFVIVKTAEHRRDNTVKAAPTGPMLDIPLIVILAILLLILILFVIDCACCRFNKRGIIYAISMKTCNKKEHTIGTAGSKGTTTGEKVPLGDIDAMERFHDTSDLQNLPQHSVSQPLIINAKPNGGGANGTPTNTFV